MSEIQYMKKPDWISWDEVQECQSIAHEQINNKIGIHMHCQDMTGAELEKDLEGGTCYVALEGKRVVGLCALQNVREIKKFWKKIKVGYLSMAAILPKYRGGEVYFGLQNIRMCDIKQEKIDVVYFSTAEHNMQVRKLNEKQGFKYVQFKASPITDYYSVVMAKWLTGPPPNRILLKTRYLLYYAYVKLRYKPGHIKRFGI